MDEASYQKALESDPGHPLFAEYADALRQRGRFQDALDVCFSGLTANPDCHRGRLVLARIHYERMHRPFAIAELERLHEQVPENEQVTKLLLRIAPEILSARKSPAGGETVVAESEFDLADVELLGDRGDSAR